MNVSIISNVRRLCYENRDAQHKIKTAPIGNVVRTAEECRPRPYIKSREYPQLYSRPCNRSERSSLFLLYIHFILLCTYIVSTVTLFVVHFLFIVSKSLITQV
uniref:Uncharacterized protein n=1 Tax=Heterorhabditis bacteriophora TaxID=37862 RepID=A0A1I7WK73_HETBA